MELFDGLTFPMVWIWVGIAVIFAVIEALTVGLTTIWFAGGAMAAALVSKVTDSIFIQVLIFLLVSLVLLFFTRPIALKKLNRVTVKTNLDAIVGSTAVADSDINADERGQVTADGKVWTAVLAEGSGQVKAGDRIVIEAIEGVKLIVRRKEND